MTHEQLKRLCTILQNSSHHVFVTMNRDDFNPNIEFTDLIARIDDLVDDLFMLVRDANSLEDLEK